jgi:cobyrinic acid a,c-diamide synthase
MMYLCREMVDFEGNVYPLTGLVPAACQMQKRLVTVGYVEAEACRDTVLCPRKGKIRGHEFHFSTMVPDADNFSWAFIFRRQRDGSTYPGGYCSDNLLASYLHCHFAGNPETALCFLEKCRVYREKHLELNL